MRFFSKGFFGGGTNRVSLAETDLEAEIFVKQWKVAKHSSGQILATSAEVTPNGGLVRESPPNPLNSGLGIIIICPDSFTGESCEIFSLD